jgi:hypothetical protein
VSCQTKEYLGWANSGDQEEELDPSTSISYHDSDSDDLYVSGIERSPRIAPQLANLDDEIYGEFDPTLVTQQEITVIIRIENLVLCHNYDKTNNFLNTFPASQLLIKCWGVGDTFACIVNMIESTILP